jgi:hypothetical protein
MSDDTQALELWQAEWDKLGDGIHAYTRARQSGVNAIASLQARLAVAEGAFWPWPARPATRSSAWTLIR